MQALLDLHSTDVGHLLSDLTARNLLLVNWKGRWSSYQVNENYQPEAEQIDLSDIFSDDQDSLRKSDKMIYEYICTNGFITSSQVISLVPDITTKSGATAALRRLIKGQLIEKVREEDNLYTRKNRRLFGRTCETVSKSV